MRISEFGKVARTLRMEIDKPLKAQAEAMLISSAHLSALEYGEKRLNESHVDLAIQFFKRDGVAEGKLVELRTAAGKSMEEVSTKLLSGDARAMVYAFARRLQEDGKPPESLEAWIKGKS